MKVNWEVECRRVFIPTGEVNKNGKEKLMPVDIRTLYFEGDFIGSKKYKVTVTKRNKAYRFTFHYWPEPVPSRFVKLDPDPEPEWKRVKEPNGKVRSYSEQEFKEELRHWLGVEADKAVWAVLTAIPENLAA